MMIRKEVLVVNINQQEQKKQEQQEQQQAATAAKAATYLHISHHLHLDKSCVALGREPGRQKPGSRKAVST